MRLAIATSLLVRPLSFLIPFLTVPLFYRYLGGGDGYGTYELIGSIAAYLAATNLGLSLGLTNKLTDCTVSGDRELARRYVSTLFIALCAIAFAATLVWSLVVSFVDWSSLFHTSSINRATFSWALWLAGVLTIATIISSLPTTIYFSEQQLYRSNLWEAVGRALTLAACFAVLRTQWRLVGVLLAVSGTPVFVRVINMVFLFSREKRYLRPTLALFDSRLLRETVGEGLLLFILQLANLLLFQIDKLIIGVGVDTRAVAGYAIVGRLYLIAYGVFMTVLTPLWPATGEAIRRGDVAWVRKSLRYSVFLGVALPAICAACLCLWHRAIFAIYLHGANVDISLSIILGLGLTFCLRAWVDSRSIILNSIGVIRPQLVFYAGHAALNIICAVLLVRTFGAAGVAWSTPLTALVTSAWGYPWLVRKLVTGPSAPKYGAKKVGVDL